jgi:hypothetical protein
VRVAWRLRYCPAPLVVANTGARAKGATGARCATGPLHARRRLLFPILKIAILSTLRHCLHSMAHSMASHSMAQQQWPQRLEQPLNINDQARVFSAQTTEGSTSLAQPVVPATVVQPLPAMEPHLQHVQTGAFLQFTAGFQFSPQGSCCGSFQFSFFFQVDSPPGFATVSPPTSGPPSVPWLRTSTAGPSPTSCPTQICLALSGIVPFILL